MREVRHDHAKRCQGHDNAEIGIGSLEVVVLFMPPPASDQKAQPDHSVEDDHHHGKERVAHQRRIVFAVTHDSSNGHYLDRRDGQRQNKRPIRLAQSLREMIGMTHDRKSRPKHD